MGSATIASSGPPVPCRISDERLGSKPSPETFWKISKVWKISENMFEKLENVQMSTFEVSNYPYIPHFRSSFRSRKSANPTSFRRGYQKKYPLNERKLYCVLSWGQEGWTVKVWIKSVRWFRLGSRPYVARSVEFDQNVDISP